LTRWYINGQKEEERACKNGKKDGRCRAWHEDGSINAELSGIYKDGNKISNQE
jgi:antitoxin component YwqK of YwqJK toxin-antitoxin module